MTEAPPRQKRPAKPLIAAGFAAFCLSLLAFAPASLLSPVASASGADIRYQEITGTLWRGTMRGVSAGEVYLGDVRFRLLPSAFLTCAASADITVQDGAALGAGRVSLNLLTRQASVSNANFAFDLSSVRRYSLFGIPYRGRIETRNANVAWSRGGCVNAQGQIWTDVLDASSKTLVGESLLLTGPLECDGDLLAINLMGGNQQGTTEIKIAIDRSMTYRVMASVDLGTADLKNNLRRLGFEDDDGVLVFDVVGALKGVGS